MPVVRDDLERWLDGRWLLWELYLQWYEGAGGEEALA